MDVRLLFPSLYLSAPDFRGRDAVLTISHVVVEDLQTNRGTEKKPVVFFEETRAKAKATGAKERRLVLNRTNAKAIASIYGFELDNWKGKRITLYPTQCEAFGETVDCIRVRKERPTDEPRAAQQQPEPAEEEANPFDGFEDPQAATTEEVQW